MSHLCPGNGVNTNFWFDYWHPIGPIYKHFSGNLSTSFGMTSTDCVVKRISGVSWIWHLGRRMTQGVMSLMAASPGTFVPLITSEDQLVWTASASSISSVKSAMQVMRSEG